MSPSGLWTGACMPGPPRWVGPSGPQPAASGAGRGGAQRSRLDPVRLSSAVQRISEIGVIPCLQIRFAQGAKLRVAKSEAVRAAHG
jgi:hypothetical protein